ncbi:unnamed protein product, partial [Mesorhabditis spiculigera]
MTPEGEQARRDAQNVLAANPRSRQIQASKQLMLGDPNSEASEPPITETGTGSPVGDAILADQTQEPITSNIGGRDYTHRTCGPGRFRPRPAHEPITSNIGGQDYTTEPAVSDVSFTDENGTNWSGTPSKVPNVWSWTYTDAQGEEHDLQVTYDEQGRPYQVFDHSNSELSLYDWSTGEPLRRPPLRGARLAVGAIRAEDLIVSNRTTPTRPPVTSPSTPAQNIPRPGTLPPRGIPVIDGTVPPAEHDHPTIPSVNEPARPGSHDSGTLATHFARRSRPRPVGTIHAGEIGDPGPNLTPGISTPNVPSPGQVEEPSAPTLPDVGQVPVNPDAPGAPQQPGLPEFDPFATDPEHHSQPWRHRGSDAATRGHDASHTA